MRGRTTARGRWREEQGKVGGIWRRGWGREKVRGWREARLMEGRKVKRRRRGGGPKKQKKRRRRGGLVKRMVLILWPYARFFFNMRGC